MPSNTTGPDEANSSEERIKRFLATASHDLQSPLRHIAMYAEILIEDLEDKIDAEQRQSLTAILEKAQAAQKLTKALMSFAAGAPQTTATTIDFAAAANAVWNEARAETGASEAVLTHGELPALRTDPVIFPAVLKHVFLNALVHRSSKQPHVEIRAELDASEWLVTIADNGAGIDPAYQDRIFDPFWKLPKPGAVSGPGLGLTMARELLSALGGTITLEHSSEAGSRFAIRLPAA